MIELLSDRDIYQPIIEFAVSSSQLVRDDEPINWIFLYLDDFLPSPRGKEINQRKHCGIRKNTTNAITDSRNKRNWNTKKEENGGTFLCSLIDSFPSFYS
ncbi:hypothetical protein TNCT_383921 [Trichonephila clavata]|uniref:Uncharacterized protein n=1 Tax=Trichonephila clavata TaxID=2740835 RepID=A0A8X6J3H2_TRICU|nr:hypothetical protein TNCT_383921 [Trichonephila clavata]